jgi:hypothetical protein
MKQEEMLDFYRLRRIVRTVKSGSLRRKDKKFMRNFGEETSCKMYIWKTENMGGQN